jgi:trk system potassium uptake protein TrkH
MAAAVVAFRLIGRNVHLMDRMALRDSLGLPDLRNIMRLVERVLLTVAVIQGVGAILLWLNWRDTLGGQIGAGRTIFYALFHSASAFCNAGFDLFSGLPAYPAGIPTDDITLLINGVLIVLGGLGIPVLADMITYPWNHRLSLHTRITLVLVAFLIMFGGVALLLSEARAGGVLAGQPWHRQVTLAFFQSVSARTAGFAALPNFENLNAASEQIIMMLMYVGCAPASMGGGITTGTLVVLVLALWGYARGLPTACVRGRRIPVETVRKAGAILTVSILLTSASTWLLLLTHDTTLDRAVFEVISAFATCGLSLAFTGELNGFGQALIMFLMFWGRLGALTIVLALARRQSPDRVHFPEEQVLIG